MSDGLEFGTRVRVERFVVRVHQGGDDYRPALRRDGSRYFRDGVRLWTGDAWPGEACPGSDEPTDKRNAGHARLRRFPFPEPLEGIVLGVVDKQEGYTTPGGAYGGYFDAPEYDAPYFNCKRRVRLYEAAIPPMRASGRGRILLVHPDDIAALLTVA